METTGALRFPLRRGDTTKVKPPCLTLEARFIELIELGIVEELGSIRLLDLINRREARVEVERRRQIKIEEYGRAHGVR